MFYSQWVVSYCIPKVASLCCTETHICTLTTKWGHEMQSFAFSRMFVCWLLIFREKKRKSDTLESVNRLICVYSKLESQGEKAFITWEITWWLVVKLTLIWKGSELDYWQTGILLPLSRITASDTQKCVWSLTSWSFTQGDIIKSFCSFKGIYIYACFCL